MSNIARRPDGRWRDRYRDAGLREHSRHFPRKVEGQAWLNSVAASAQSGSYVDPARAKMTVGVNWRRPALVGVRGSAVRHVDLMRRRLDVSEAVSEVGGSRFGGDAQVA